MPESQCHCISMFISHDLHLNVPSTLAKLHHEDRRAWNFILHLDEASVLQVLQVLHMSISNSIVIPLTHLTWIETMGTNNTHFTGRNRDQVLAHCSLRLLDFGSVFIHFKILQIYSNMFYGPLPSPPPIRSTASGCSPNPFPPAPFGSLFLHHLHRL